MYGAQFQLIRSIADKDESSIFIGRCADYVLEERKELVKIYISADIDYRVKRVAKEHNIGEAEALKMIQKRDKQRASYYNFYTSKKWSEANSYDLCINSGKVGTIGAVQLILNYLNLNELSN